MSYPPSPTPAESIQISASNARNAVDALMRRASTLLERAEFAEADAREQRAERGLLEHRIKAAEAHVAKLKVELEAAERRAREQSGEAERMAGLRLGAEDRAAELQRAVDELKARERSEVTHHVTDGAITLDLRAGVIVGATINGEEVLAEPARVALDERTRQSIETAAAAINRLGEHLRPRLAAVPIDPAARSAARSLEAAHRATRATGHAFGTTTVVTSDLGRALARLERLERLADPPIDNARDTASS